MNTNTRKHLLLGLMTMSMAQTNRENFEAFEEEQVFKKEKTLEPKPGQFYYWFRIDGTFLSEKQDERMLKEDCAFTCFAINDKNAIKKFNKWKNNL